MKKLLLSLIVLVLFCSLTACVSTGEAGGNKNNGNNSYDQYKNPVEAEKIVIENPEQWRDISILRRNITEGSQDYENDFYNYIYLGQNNKTEIKDPFVYPGDTYQYVVYGTDYNNERVEIANIKITAKEGVGELDYVTQPKCSFDKKTGIMTFSVLPEFSKDIQNYIEENKGKIWENLRYIPQKDSLQNNSDNWIETRIIKETDFSAAITNEELFGENFFLSQIMLSVNFGGIQYYKNFTDEDKSHFISNIILPDKRIELKAEATKDGIRLTLPPAPEKASRFWIERRDLNKPEEIQESLQSNRYISVNSLTSEVITDYFVNKGEEYEYILFFIADFPEEDAYGITVQTSKPVVVKAVGGEGDLYPTEIPEADFDSKTGIMKFTKVPKLKKGYRDFVKNKNGWFNSFISYSNENGVTVVMPVSENTPEEFNLKEIKNNEGKLQLTKENYGKNLELKWFYNSVSIDGVSYTKRITKQGLPNMPEYIKVEVE